MPAAAEARVGRPPKRDQFGTATRERLLAAAVATCIDEGFDGATLNEIARRAEVSGPAIYNHFGSKVELMVASAHAALDALAAPSSLPPSARATVRAFLADEFSASRRFLAELHLVSHRYPELAVLLGAWHREQAARWVSGPEQTREARVATLFSFLLGLCQIESLDALGVPATDVARQAEAIAEVLFPE